MMDKENIKMNSTKYKDYDVIQFVEEVLEIKLLPYQKILIDKIFNKYSKEKHELRKINGR